MEEIDLIELFRFYIKRIYIVILVVLISLLGGYFYVQFVKKPMYVSKTTVLLVQKEDNKDITSAITQNDLTISEKLISTYREIVKSRRVLSQVISDLNLNESVESLSGYVNVSAVDGTSIIEISVNYFDSKSAMRIANDISDKFQKEVVNLYNLENVSVVDKAVSNSNPYNMNLVKDLMIFGLFGLVFSSGIIFVLFYFNNSVNNRKEIEDRLGLFVLSEVPFEKKDSVKSFMENQH